MNINIKTSNTELTDALRAYVNDKVGNLERHMRKTPTNVDVELEHMPAHHSGPVFRCEINIAMPGEKQVLRGESVETDMYAAIDTCVPKIKEQLNKESDRRESLVRRGGRRLKELTRKLWG